MNRALPVLAALVVAAACSSPQPEARVSGGRLAVAPAWAMFRGDAARDGHPFGVTLTPSTAAKLALSWRVDLGSPIVAGPVVAGGILVVGTADGTIAAISTEDGAVLWKQRGLGSLVGQPLIWQGTVYAGSGDGRLRALDLATGTPTWDWRAPGGKPAIEGGPVVFGGLLLAGIGSQPGEQPAEPGRLLALDPASGDRVWATCLLTGCGAGDGVSSGIAVDPSGFGFVGADAPDAAIASFDPGIGRVRWRTSISPADGRALGLAATPLLFLAHGRERVAAGAGDGTFAVLDAASGAVVWSRHLAAGVPGRFSGSPGFDGRALYVPSAGSPGGVFALNPGDGSTVWLSASRPVLSSPAIGLGVVVFGEGDPAAKPAAGAVVALSTLDGRELWRYETKAAVVASPALVGAAVFAADASGGVLAFR